jgi:Skp family chaperone for outer membrane proteins
MKKLSVLIAVAVLASALTASAQSKLASVDMKKLFNNYYKTKSAQVVMDKEKSDLVKELKDMAADLDKLRTEYKQLLDQANDQAISGDEREKRKAAAGDKARDLNKQQVGFEQYQRQAEARLGDKSQRMTAALVKEIQDAVNSKAKAGGYTAVLDTAAVSASGTPTVIYCDPAIDITTDVLNQLQAGAPIDVVKPAGSLLNIRTNAP